MALPVAAYSLVAYAQQPAGGKGGAKGAGAASASAAVAASAAPAASAPAAAPSASAAAAPAPASSSSAAAAAPAGSSDQGMNGATYAVRLRDLEQRVDELKDQIRRSHTRLALLSDTIIGGGAAGSRSEVEYKNEMSSAFQLTRALFVIDGQVQYNRQDDSGALADQKDIPIYSGSVPPGDHTIQVALTFQGNGYGVFSYLRGYKFEVKSSHAFTAVEGKTITVTATSFEKGGVTTPLEQRPAIEWKETLQPLGGGAVSAAPAPGAQNAPGAPGNASVSGSISIGGGKK
ncbi:MAG TPA: hypothetical protein VMI75_24920 [Polyangiaceae bacterium]|nr:hypothetical protein [Polyangiaceae bacterium]